MKDRTGEKYNKLTAIKFSHREGNNYYWVFKCECGVEKNLNINNVIRTKNPTLSCGCSANRIYYGLDALKYSCYSDCRYSDGDLTFEEFVELSQKPCLYCGKLPQDSNCRKTRINKRSKKNLIIEKFYYNGLDRVDNTKPHMKNNVVPCCARCNSWKQNLTFEEFKTIIERIHLKVRDLYI